MTPIEQIQMERLINMRDWRLREDRTFHHEAEAQALQWAIDIINAHTNTNGGSADGSITN